VLLKKLIPTQLMKKFPNFYETYSQEPNIGTCPQSNESSPHSSNPISYIHSNINCLPMSKSIKWSLPFRFYDQNCLKCICVIFPICAPCPIHVIPLKGNICCTVQMQIEKFWTIKSYLPTSRNYSITTVLERNVE
jgi:hypothetical protein